MITVICPTLNRASTLRDFVASVVSTSEAPAAFEIVFLVNDEDVATRDEVGRLRQVYGAYNIRMWIAPEFSTNLSEGYFNRAWRAGAYRGNYYWATGDDFRVFTPGWDRIITTQIETRLKDCPDRILLSFCKDIIDRDKPKIEIEWGCFPILTREAVEVLGWFFPKEYATWGADVLMCRIFSDPRVHRVERIYDVEVDQVSYHSYPDITRDSTSKMIENTYKTPEVKMQMRLYDATQKEIDIKRLANAISGMVEE